MTLRVVVVLVVAVLAVLGGSCDPCDENGHAYQCTCTRRCQGATTTTTPSFACFTGGSVTEEVTAACEDSCDPPATCSCSCTEGAACVVEGSCS